MYRKDNYIHIVKGAMDVAEVNTLLQQLPDDIRQLPMVLHFRLATHGSISPENCHPFPITTDKAVLGLTELECKTAIAHNGIIPSNFVDAKHVRRVWVSGRKQEDDEDELSDTGIFVREYLAPMGKALHNQVVAKLLGVVGKIAILDAKRGCTLIGGFTQDNGRFYSNDTYKKTTYALYQNGKHQREWYEGEDDEYGDYGHGWCSAGGKQHKYVGQGECAFCHQSMCLWHVDDVVGDLCWHCLNEWKDFLKREAEEEEAELKKIREEEVEAEKEIVLLTEKANEVEEVAIPLLSDEEKNKKYQDYKEQQRKKDDANIFLPAIQLGYTKLKDKIWRA